MESTLQTNSNASDNIRYCCVFQAIHPNDYVKSEEFSEWWPEWYLCKKTKESNELVYKQRILNRKKMHEPIVLKKINGQRTNK